MLLLYIDESGGFDKDLQYGIFGGIAVHEADLADLKARVEAVVASWLDEHNRTLELHASDMRTGSRAWRKIPPDVRSGLLNSIVELIGSYKSPTDHPYSLFAVARAPHAVPGADPVERSFQELLYHFGSALHALGPEARGIVIADEARYEQVIQPIVSRWQQEGDSRRYRRLRPLNQIPEVPLFADSRVTRLLQLADIVAHVVYLSYERKDDQLLGPLLRAFSTDGAVMHGLTHLTPNFKTCPCPACISRLTRDRLRASRKQKEPEMLPFMEEMEDWEDIDE